MLKLRNSSRHTKLNKFFRNTSILLFIAVFSFATITLPVRAIPATVLLGGNEWFGGAGVNVCDSSTQPTCGGEAHVGGWSENWWQCVELAQRLYQKYGWHSGIFGGVERAYQIYDNASSLNMSRQANGNVVSIVPGDMIVHAPDMPYSDGAGHVSIVDSVNGSIVNVVEQNTANDQPRATYSWTNNTLSRAGTGTIKGVVHDPGNLSMPTTPMPNPDSDNDGIGDAADWCPEIPGSILNYGCPRPNSQKMVGDFNNDGRADLAAFFDYGGGNLGLFTWNGQADGKYGAPDKKWQATSGWEATRITPVGTGDFDGDTHQDVAAFFNYGNGESRLFVWYGNGNGSFAAASSAWHASSGWDGARITPGGLGDFNNDGRTDITAFFNYGGGQTALFAWNGQANRSFTAPTKHWEALSGWDTRRLSTGTAGDFNGDGYQDVAAFFDYGGTSMGAFIWSGSSTGALTIQPRAWFVASGWENKRVIPAGASDFNKDGRADLAAFFDYGGGNSALFTWSGQTDSKFGAADKKWQATSGWDGTRITPLGSADFNGDSNADVTALFDYGGTSTGAFIWSGNGSGSFTLLSRAWFAASGWESSRIIPNR